MLALQEKERVASEEAERRLKAALTAKREPNTSVSRVASPNPSTENPANAEAMSEPRQTVSSSQNGDVAMENVEEKVAPSTPEVHSILHRNIAGS